MPFTAYRTFVTGLRQVGGVPGAEGRPGPPGGSDESFAAWVADRTSKTRSALRGRIPAALSDAGVVDVAAEVNGRPCEYLNGYWWGYGSSTAIYRSSDGVTWTSYATAPSGQLQRIIPTGGNSAIIVTDLAIYKSANFFAGPSPTFSAAKVTVNGAARHTRFGVSSTPQGRTSLDDGRKIIVSQYGPGAAAFADSRYAYISLDYGETWTQAWDSNTDTTNVDTASHVHGCEYDPYEDAFYVIEGHSTDAGVWRSTDNGNTWTLHAGYRMFSAPTCCVATDDGLFLSSDDPQAGTLGIPRVGSAALRSIIRTWSWRTGFGSDVLGFGTQATRDPDTGIVYAAYQSSFAGQAPIVAGGTATVGGLVFAYPDAASVVAADEFNALALDPVAGVIKAPALVGGARKIVTGHLTRLHQVGTSDPGGILGGQAESGTSVAVGAGATVDGASAPYNRGAAVGVNAKAQQDALAAGYGANGGATGVVALGYQAVATAAGAVVIGRGVATTFSGTLIGDGAANNGTGGAATAVGGASATWTNGTAVGHGANVEATGGVAIGHQANVDTAHTNSVALGKDTTTTAGQQVQIGPKHIGRAEVATEPTAPAADSVRDYAIDNGAGKTELRARFNGSSAGTAYARQGEITLLGLRATAMLDFPSIAANSAQELTVAITGAAVGDTVMLGAPAAIEAGLTWVGWVSATNTVRIRLSNLTAAAIDPASASWTVTLTH